MGLDEYDRKRDFDKTPEPPPGAGRPHKTPIFVVQEHHASKLHYDFRLEAEGVLKSWAVPRAPSLDPADKRLAVRVEDHPLGYATFEGTIPRGQYGAGEVRIWDRGTYQPVGDFAAGVAAGKLEFVLRGEKLRGGFTLVRMKGRERDKENWLLIKKRDEFAAPAKGGDAKPKPAAKKAPKARASAPRVRRAVAGSGGGVTLTSLDRVMFPDAGITKGDVIEYYRRIAPRLLPVLRDRPATLERAPEGLVEGGAHFWQKNTPETYPDWIPRVELPSERGKPVRYALVNDLDTLLYLVNQGTLTFHVWFSRVGDLDRPDFVLFDLDRGPAPFADAVRVAHELRRVLTDAEAPAFVKTSGKTGLHVLVPWEGDGGYDEARAWALEVAEGVCGELPDVATTEIRKAKRKGRLYIDVMQNARGHHAVPPYVLRAVPGAPVSTPLSWKELTPDLDPAGFNLKTVFRRFARQKRDPLAGLVAGE